jgi:hypothetical protein
MWLSFIENPVIFKSIYGQQIPELRNVFFHEIKISMGEEISSYLKFDINVLPQKVPEKWVSKKVNKVQLDFMLISSEIEHLNMSGMDLIGDLKIELIDKNKKVSFTVNGRNVFVIKTKWIYVRSVTGYYSAGPFELNE